MVTKVQRIITKTGKPMLFSWLEDLTSKIEVVVFPGVLEKYPEIKKIKETMLESGASHSLMSGKGSAVFGLFKDKKIAMGCRDKLEKAGNKVFIVTSL